MPDATHSDEQFSRDAQLQLALKWAALLANRNSEEWAPLIGDGEDDEPDHGRAEALRALVGVIEYLLTNSKFAAWLDPLNKLAMALIAVEEGHKHPMLMPAEQGHKVKGDFFYQSIRGTLAGVMHVGLSAKKSREEIARDINRTLAKSGYSLPGKRGDDFISVNTIRNWRQDILDWAPMGGQRKKRPREVTAFEAILEVDRVARQRGSSPEAVYQRMLGRLPDLIAQHTPHTRTG